MKKLLVIVAVLAIATTSFGQTTFGVKAGLNIANMKYSGSGLDISPDSKVGPAIGLFAKFNVSESFAVQPELLYSAKGSKIEISEGGASASSTIKLNYISLPIMAKYYVSPGFNLQAGPQIDFLLSAKEDWEMSMGTDSESGSDDIKEDVNGIDFGLGFGLGYDLEMGLGFDARYVLGLSELAKDPEDGVKTKSTGFQITVSYAF